MRYAKVLSGLVLTGLLAVFATAQDKPKPVEKPQEEMRYEVAKLLLGEVVKPEPTIANIVANHPDVKLAEAKLQVAKAELDKARILTIQKYSIAKGKLEEAKEQLRCVTQRVKILEKLRSTGLAATEIAVEEQLLSQAKSAVVIAEAELKVFEGTTSPQRSTILDDRAEYYRAVNDRPSGVELGWQSKPTTQSAKLRDVLERKVALDLSKPLPLDELMAIFLPKSGLDAFLVRYPEWASAKQMKTPPRINLPKSEQLVSAWLQLIQDEFNSQSGDVPVEYRGRYMMYVRDYGLLFAKSDSAPQGALKLEEFMRLPPVVEAPKEATKEASKN